MENQQQETASNNGGSKVKVRTLTKAANTEMSLLVMYIIQRRGSATYEDITAGLMEEFNAKARDSTLGKVIEGLRGRDFIALSYGTDGEGQYRMKKVKFNPTTLEIAHVTYEGVIPRLQTDPVGLLLLNELGDKTNETKKKGDRPEEIVDYTLKIRLDTPIYGSQPLKANPGLIGLIAGKDAKSAILAHAADPNANVLAFQRTADGDIMIHAACIRGWFRQHLFILGMSEWKMRFFLFSPLIVRNPPRIVCECRPIQRAGEQQNAGKGSSGAGLCHLETLPGGTELEIQFAAPTKNFITPDEMRLFIGRILKYNVQSFSPARGKETGTGTLVDFSFSDPWPVAASTMRSQDGGASDGVAGRPDGGASDGVAGRPDGGASDGPAGDRE